MQVDANLSKSLSDLEAIANEILSKSEETEELNAKDVSEDSKEKPESKESENKSSDESEKNEEPKDSEPEEEPDDDESEDDDEEMEKSLESKELDDDDEPLEDGEPDDDEDDELEKSIRLDFENDSEISSFIKSSEFCSAVVDILSKSLSNNVLEQRKNSNLNAQSMEVMAKSMMAVIARNDQLSQENRALTRKVLKLQKSITQRFDVLDDRLQNINDALEEFGDTPQLRKSVNSVEIHDRNFNSSLGTPAPDGYESLSKAQVMSVLTNELYNGNPMVTSQDVISFESGAPLRPELRGMVANKSK